MSNKLAVHGFNPLHVKTLVGNYHQSLSRIIVGNNKFALRQVSEFTIDDIAVANDFCQKFAIDCYVMTNKLFHNHELRELETYLKELNNLKVTGVIFSDLAVLHICTENNLDLKLVYSTETTITNSGFTTYAKANKIDEIEVAKEITLKEVNGIATDGCCDVSIQIHGHLYMYQSIRKMIDNWGQFQGIELADDNYYLFDQERNNIYPIIQNQQGTHLLASSNLCLVHKLNDLEVEKFKSFRLDPLFYTISEYNNIVKIYIKALDLRFEDPEQYLVAAKDLAAEIEENKPGQKYSTGLMYRKTIF